MNQQPCMSQMPTCAWIDWRGAPTRLRALRAIVRILLLAAAMVPTLPRVSRAADVYVQPEFDLRAEYNDNFALQPEAKSEADAYGVIADAQALIGIATPRSDSVLRPRLRLQEYSDIDDLQGVEKVKPLEAFLDFRSTYRWGRGDARIFARYSIQDSYNADTPSGIFDPLDPLYGSDPDSLRVRVGETRNAFEFRPRFRYDLTQRLAADIGAEYQTVNYESESTISQIDYDFTVLDGAIIHALTELSEISVGGYASQYQAKNESTETDAYGGSLGYAFRWSELTGVEVSIFYEQNDISYYVPVRFEETTSGWGGSLTAYRKQDVSEWRAVLERRFIPTGEGGKSESDLFRLQYDRDLSERLSFQGAGRFETRSSLSEALSNADRDYARVDVSLEWLMTPTWYIRGGYSYLWEDRETAVSDASNNRLFLSVGYKALSRRHR